MIALKKLQAKKQEEKQAAAAAANNNTNNTNSSQPTQSPCEIRVQKDFSDMGDMRDIPGAKVEFPNANDLLHFNVLISPADGLYHGATFKFSIDIPTTYPFDAPKVHCQTLVYHPNIDWEGHVCLNILREEWNPVLGLGAVLHGLNFLFLEPNAGDPLNKDAANQMIERPKDFERVVKQTLKGGYHMGKNFPSLVR
eukprot:TRINITY_DN1861_c0_g1_i1.p1 TRINITY_DN1861_c0_g1~~TRINITY_DN1861_c0_g1_i1.p1  ORF type:complete len:196 (-),score=79.42 TRINITY_DN1861_c0_g1_i1:90-677(-)